MASISVRGPARTARLATSALVVCGILFASSVSRSDQASTSAMDSSNGAIPGEFVVELRGSAATELRAMDVRSLDIQALSRMLGVQVVERVRDEMVLVRAPKDFLAGGNDSTAMAAMFQKPLLENPIVSRVEPNYIYQALKTPNDPDLEKTWGLKNTGAADTAGRPGVLGVDIGAEKAWDITTGSKSVIVAVIDTGIDFGHPDLKNQAWVNEKELNGSPGVDDDGNGLIDDVHGYNFADNKGDSTDDNAHGTHCAGTIGAQGDDGRGLVGVNWHVTLMAVKFLNKSGSGSLANAIKSVDYARKQGAQIMSNSWGGGKESDLLKTAIQEAADAGILFVAAAGNEANDNDANPFFPAGYDVENVLSVAAVDNRGALASFSNFGLTTVDVAAPGVNIVSTVPGGKYDSYSGTSMAAPHVSGIAALLLARNSKLSALDLKNKIMTSARPLYGLKKRVASGGLTDAYYALSGLTPPADPNDPSTLPVVTPHSFSSDHPYVGGTKLEHTFRIPGAKRVAIRFSKFDTELGYDTVSFFDASGTFMGVLSGTQDSGVTSPAIFGDEITLKFSSDASVSAYGFDVDAILSE